MEYGNWGKANVTDSSCYKWKVALLKSGRSLTNQDLIYVTGSRSWVYQAYSSLWSRERRSKLCRWYFVACHWSIPLVSLLFLSTLAIYCLSRHSNLAARNFAEPWECSVGVRRVRCNNVPRLGGWGCVQLNDRVHGRCEAQCCQEGSWEWLCK